MGTRLKEHMMQCCWMPEALFCNWQSQWKRLEPLMEENTGDGRPFWRLLVSEATDCTNADYFEEVYEPYYGNGEAWRLPAGSYQTISLFKEAGVKMAVVSNFDTRLRKLLKDLNVIDLFDAVVVSSEVGFEKPDQRIIKSALDQISVKARKAVHIRYDEKADKLGANAIGIDCGSVLTLH